MTTSPLTDAIIVELRRLAAMKDKIFAAQCLGRDAGRAGTTGRVSPMSDYESMGK